VEHVVQQIARGAQVALIDEVSGPPATLLLVLLGVNSFKPMQTIFVTLATERA
jgi:hypothetical protein